MVTAGAIPQAAGGPTVVVGSPEQLDELDVAVLGSRLLDLPVEQDGPQRRLRVHGVGDGLWIRGESERWTVVGWGFMLAEPGDPGASWRSIDGDTVASRLEAHGIDVLPTFQGSHVLAALDRRDGRVYFMGDPSQVRRWNLWSDGQLCIASTKPTRVASVLGGMPENRGSRDFFMVYGYHPGEESMFEGVTRARGGVVYTTSDGGIERVDTQAPTPSGSTAGSTDFDAAVERLHDVLLEAVRAQMRGMSRAAVLLGGFDSALVAALGVRAGLEVETYSFGYGDPAYDQPNTGVLADALGVRHHWVPMEADTIDQGLRRYGALFDAPTNWANYPIQTVAVGSRILADGHDAILTGDGCDGTFYGYPGVFKSYRIAQALPPLPAGATSAMNRWLARLGVERLAGQPARLLMRFLRLASEPAPDRWYFMYRIMDEASVATLTGGDQHDIERRVEEVRAEVRSAIPSGTPALISYAGKNVLAPSKIKLAAVGDCTGLTVFSPYMHPVVGALVKTYPDEWLRPEGASPEISSIGKYILVKMAQRYDLLPDEVILQPKVSAVHAPVEGWYRGPLRPTLEDLLGALPFATDSAYLDDLFATKRPEEFYATHLSTDTITSHALMLLATYGAYFDG